MIEEAKKSIQSTLSQRMTSPFYGTLIVSWLIWNWKIIYLTFFVSEKKIELSKIDYIVKNYSDPNHLIWFPLLSAVALLTVIPFITNGAFWLDLVFDNWRLAKKNEIEKKQLLTVEQSIKLREQIINMEKLFDSLLSDKNSEIDQLKALIADFESEKSKTNQKDTAKRDYNEQTDIEYLAKKIMENEKLTVALRIINNFVLGRYTGLIKNENTGPEILGFFESNGLIEASNEPGLFKWTPKGKEVNKIITRTKF